MGSFVYYGELKVIFWNISIGIDDSFVFKYIYFIFLLNRMLNMIDVFWGEGVWGVLFWISNFRFSAIDIIRF